MFFRLNPCQKRPLFALELLDVNPALSSLCRNSTYDPTISFEASAKALNELNNFIGASNRTAFCSQHAALEQYHCDGLNLNPLFASERLHRELNFLLTAVDLSATLPGDVAIDKE